MREAMIICPVNDNNGLPVINAITNVMRDMVAMFGGCTTVDAQGVWDGGKLGIIAEQVKQCIAAYDPSAEKDRLLRDIAERFGYAAKQACVYVRYANGDVEIVDTSAALTVAA